MQLSRFFYALILICSWSLLHGQQAETGALRKQFEQASNDSLRLNAAKQLFARYIYTIADSAIFYAEHIVSIGETNDLEKEILNGNNYLGIAYSIKGDYSRAADYMQEVLRLHTEAGDSLNMAYSHNNLGLNYTYAGDFLKAAESLIASSRIKEALINSGTSAADVDLASTIVNIGIAYQNQADTTQALAYFNRAVEEAEKIGDRVNAAKARNGIGNIYVEQERYKGALEQFSQIEEVFSEMNDQFSLGKLYNSMALAHGSLYSGSQTISFARKAIDINSAIGNGQSEAMGKVYLGLGYILTGQHREAIRVSNEALTYAEEFNANSVKIGALKNLYEAYAALGDYKRAYDYSILYKEVDELIFAEERAEQIERLSAQYEAEKRQQEIENLNRETELQSLQLAKTSSERNLLFVVVGSLVLILLLIAWFYRKILDSRKQLQSKNLELDKLNSTKDRLFSIISHDIRGHISAFRGNGKLLKHLMAKKETEKLEKVTVEIDRNAQNLGELLDNLLHWSLDQLKGYEPRPESIELKKVTDDLVEIYQPLAAAKGITLRSELDTDSKVMADLNGLSVILRNLIANAIKFTDQGEVVVSGAARKGQVGLAVRDTGIGIPKDLIDRLFQIDEDKIRRGTRNEKGTGLGLNLAFEFARANGGQLEVQSAEGEGSTFFLYLPHA